MSKPHFRYEPSQAHKTKTTAAGPPKWNPYKEKCPSDLTRRELEELLDESVSADGRSENAHRFALRHTAFGVEIYESRLTRVKPDGTIIVHGYPSLRDPPRVLRQWRDEGKITKPEYNRLRKELG